jgi:hypothetical protein
MSEPYLIAHFVRGEPAFDIAIKLQIGDEEGWIIPTSGHRAYPSDYIRLDRLMTGDREFAIECMALPGPNHPDHYTTHAALRTGLITNLAERLGFVPKPTTITRR